MSSGASMNDGKRRVTASEDGANRLSADNTAGEVVGQHSRPRATIVIPARNEQSTITSCLESVRAQTLHHIEILVVDGESTDDTRGLVAQLGAKDSRIKLIQNPGRTAPAAMNVGLRAARGEYLIRVDAHSTIPPNYVENAVKHLCSGRFGGVGGRKDGVGYTRAGRAIAAAMASRIGVGNSEYHYAQSQMMVAHVPFGSYVTNVARQLGGWSEALPTNQDYEFDWRLTQSGQRLLLDPSLVISWECRQSIAGLYRQYMRYGRGKARVMAIHPRSAKLRHVLPTTILLALAGSGVSSVLTRSGRPLVVPLLYVATIGVAGQYVARRRTGEISGPLVSASFAAMHLGYGWGTLSALSSAYRARREWRAERVATTRRIHAAGIPHASEPGLAHLGRVGASGTQSASANGEVGRTVLDDRPRGLSERQGSDQ